MPHTTHRTHAHIHTRTHRAHNTHTHIHTDYPQATAPARLSAKKLEGATRVRLSDPDGFLVSNHVISDVFAALTAL